METAVAAIAAIFAFAAGFRVSQPDENSNAGDDMFGIAPMVVEIVPWVVGVLCAVGVFILTRWLYRRLPNLSTKKAEVSPLDLSAVPTPEPAATLPVDLPGPTQ